MVSPGHSADTTDAARIDAAKAALRQQVLAARSALDDDVIAAASETLQARVLEMPEVQQARTIGIYIAAGRGEVRTARLVAALLPVARVAAPRVIKTGQALGFHRFHDVDELVDAPFGLREPSPSSELIPLEEIDLMVVPGLAFDLSGGRLGYGKAFYDRTLAATPALRVALALELQIVATVPTAAHDQRMDFIVTERRQIRTGAER